jgi:hypothetical protein
MSCFRRNYSNGDAYTSVQLRKRREKERRRTSKVHSRVSIMPGTFRILSQFCTCGRYCDSDQLQAEPITLWCVRIHATLHYSFHFHDTQNYKKRA